MKVVNFKEGITFKTMSKHFVRSEGCGNYGADLSTNHAYFVSAVILVVHALINFLPTRVLAIMNGVSAVWHVVGTFTLIILLLAVAPTHQSAEYVFTTFNSDTEATGVPSSACASIPLLAFTISPVY